jgi:hypothetical protein
MSDELKRLPTFFKGIYYPNRTAARWAVFFDSLDVSFRYDPNSENTFAPDFHLPNSHVAVKIIPDASYYVETKNWKRTNEIIEWAKESFFPHNRDKAFVVAFRSPGPEPYALAFGLDEKDGSVYGGNPAYLVPCIGWITGREPFHFAVYYSSDEKDGLDEYDRAVKSKLIQHNLLMRAYETARSARFGT